MIAGQRRQASTEVLTVDYADVLRQAVLNERARVLRNVRQRINTLPVQDSSSSYRDRSASSFKRDALKQIDYEEQE